MKEPATRDDGRQATLDEELYLRFKEAVGDLTHVFTETQRAIMAVEWQSLAARLPCETRMLLGLGLAAEMLYQKLGHLFPWPWLQGIDQRNLIRYAALVRYETAKETV